MSWASHPTTEMPTKPSSSNGRHRRRTRTVIAIVAVVGLVAVVLVATFAPGLIGRPAPRDQTPQTSGLTGTPTVASSVAVAPEVSPVESSTVSATSGGTATPNATPVTVSVADSAGLEADVFALTNVERQKQGCPALRLDSSLAAAARGHSVDMARTGSFGHPGSDGSDPGRRMKVAGYDATTGWAENIARGQASATAVMLAWMGNVDHRANILDCKLKALGVGAAKGATGQLYWTQDFGAN